ncbi:MAG: glycosyltransferase family 2 protein [Acidimicrobiia bacterium]|nr:glycosyltransferase family 2 protein [Acidimicrobiia bacterium]
MTHDEPAVALSVVIPAFNEGTRIAESVLALQSRLAAVADTWEILVVDDGSTDDTARIVEQIGEADPRVVLRREPHRGKGGAVRHGLMAARGQLRFMCDADLSMPVFELPRFLDEVPGRCDIAIATREGTTARRIDEPWIRHFIGRLFNRVVRTVALAAVNDTQCGFKLFSAVAVERIVPWLMIEGWAFDVEVLFVARLRGLRVHEVPIEWRFQQRSRVRPLRDGLLMLRDVARIRWNAWLGRYAEVPSRRGSPRSEAR